MSAIIAFIMKCAFAYALCWVMPHHQEQELALPALLLVLLLSMLLWNGFLSLLSPDQSSHRCMTPANTHVQPITISSDIKKAAKYKKNSRPIIKVLIVSPASERLKRSAMYHRSLQSEFRAQAIRLKKELREEKKQRAAEQAAHKQEVERLERICDKEVQENADNVERLRVNKRRLDKANATRFGLNEVKERADRFEAMYDEKVEEIRSLKHEAQRDLSLLGQMHDEQVAKVQALKDQAKTKAHEDSIKALQQQYSQTAKVELLKHDIEYAQDAAKDLKENYDRAIALSKLRRSMNKSNRDRYNAEVAAKGELQKELEKVRTESSVALDRERGETDRLRSDLATLNRRFSTLLREHKQLHKGAERAVYRLDRQEEQLRANSVTIERLKSKLFEPGFNSETRRTAWWQNRVTGPVQGHVPWASPASAS